MNAQMCVPVSVIAQFHKIQQLTTDTALIAESIKDSTVCAVTPDGIKPTIKQERNTIILREIPSETSQDKVCTTPFHHAFCCISLCSILHVPFHCVFFFPFMFWLYTVRSCIQFFARVYRVYCTIQLSQLRLMGLLAFRLAEAHHLLGTSVQHKHSARYFTVVSQCTGKNSGWRSLCQYCPYIRPCMFVSMRTCDLRHSICTHDCVMIMRCLDLASFCSWVFDCLCMVPACLAEEH